MTQEMCGRLCAKTCGRLCVKICGRLYHKMCCHFFLDTPVSSERASFYLISLKIFKNYGHVKENLQSLKK